MNFGSDPSSLVLIPGVSIQPLQDGVGCVQLQVEGNALVWVQPRVVDDVLLEIMRRLVADQHTAALLIELAQDILSAVVLLDRVFEKTAEPALSVGPDLSQCAQLHVHIIQLV